MWLKIYIYCRYHDIQKKVRLAVYASSMGKMKETSENQKILKNAKILKIIENLEKSWKSSKILKIMKSVEILETLQKILKISKNLKISKISDFHFCLQFFIFPISMSLKFFRFWKYIYILRFFRFLNLKIWKYEILKVFESAWFWKMFIYFLKYMIDFYRTKSKRIYCTAASF